MYFKNEQTHSRGSRRTMKSAEENPEKFIDELVFLRNQQRGRLILIHVSARY